MEITLKNSVIFTLLVILGVILADGGLKIARRMRFMNYSPGANDNKPPIYATAGTVQPVAAAVQPAQPAQSAQPATASTAGVVLTTGVVYGN